MPASIHGGKARADGALPPGGSRAGRRSRGARGPCPACCSMDGFVDASPLLRPGPSIGPARAATAPARTHARKGGQPASRARIYREVKKKRGEFLFTVLCSCCSRNPMQIRVGHGRACKIHRGPVCFTLDLLAHTSLKKSACIEC